MQSTKICVRLWFLSTNCFLFTRHKNWCTDVGENGIALKKTEKEDFLWKTHGRKDFQLIQLPSSFSFVSFSATLVEDYNSFVILCRKNLVRKRRTHYHFTSWMLAVTGCITASDPLATLPDDSWVMTLWISLYPAACEESETPTVFRLWNNAVFHWM